MSWASLRDAVLQMPATGVNGFEGALATALSKLTAQNFLLSRSGDQGGIDARSLSGAIMMQAKRYGSAQLTEAQAETDFHTARRNFPDMETYLLGVTRTTAQLKTRLEQLRDDTGIDVLTIDWEGGIPDLGCLLVTYWPDLSHLPGLRKLGEQFGKWARRQASDADVQARVIELRREISDQLKSFKFLQLRATEYLGRRFGFRKPPFPRFRIDLPQGIHRAAADELWEWWQKGDSRVARLQGEEGMGKSWVAAEFAWRVANTAATLVVWLESSDWSDCKTIEEILAAALRELGERDGVVAERWIRKALKRWNDHLLIILDGANEREALPAAQRIIRDTFRSQVPKFKLLFTCRTLELRPEYDAIPWEVSELVRCEPLNDREFSEILSASQPPLQLKDVAPGLRDLARIPRYFATCIRLRNQFGSMDAVTRELILWFELLDKIKRGDEQTRSSLGLTNESDAEHVLKALAQKASFVGKVATAAFDTLNECFGGRYQEIRRDLEELRIAERGTLGAAQLSVDHVVLGFGLYLLQLVRAHPGSVKEIADLIRLTLEPLASADARTEAVFVALQLTMSSSWPDQNLAQIRAALLFTWVSLHNNWNVRARLEFWAKTDVSAYCLFLEMLFEQPLRGHIQTESVAPLAKTWKSGPEEVRNVIEQFLTKWVLLTWPIEKSADKVFDHKGHKLPLACSEEQIRLSSVAVSLIALTAEPRFLSTLALARATLHCSKVVRLVPKIDKPNEPPEEFKIGIKDLGSVIGMTMRWSFTERILPELETLAVDHSNDEVMLEGLRYLADSLWLTELPEILRSASRGYVGSPSDGVPAARLIQQRRTLFPQDRSHGYPAAMDFAHLAVRGDLPDILTADAMRIREEIEGFCARCLPHYRREMTLEDSKFDAWLPWYAKYFPGELNSLAGKLRLAALKADSPLYTLFELKWILRDPTQVPLSTLNAAFQAAALRFLTDEERTPNQVILELWPIALLELSQDQNELLYWIEFAAKHRSLRWAISFHPTCALFQPLASSLIGETAWERTVARADDPTETPYSHKEFDYWSQIAAKMIAPNRERYEWVKAQLLGRKPNGNRRLNWISLLFASATSDQFAQEFIAGIWPDVLNDEGILALSWTSHRLGNLVDEKCSYANLLQWLPRDFAGAFLANSERTKDFKRWGEELMAYALKQVGHEPFSPRFRGIRTFELDREGRVVGRGFQGPEGKHSWFHSSPTVWGIDSQGTAGPDTNDRERIWNRECALWHEDNRQLESWEGYALHTFSGRKGLTCWRKLYPKEFLDFAWRFLNEAAERGLSQFHLSCFLDAVICNLFPLAPAETLQMCARLRALPFAVSTACHVSSTIAALWDVSDCALPEHAALRIQMFRGAKSDKEILGFVIAALEQGASVELWQMLNEHFLSADLARDRALGSSILAWMGESKVTAILDNLANTDPSGWVREHAAWAAETARGEYSARETYGKLLRETDPALLSAKLRVLEPALTPTAAFWRIEVEAAEIQRERSERLTAVLQSFWNSWENHTPSSLTVYGRNLEGYCRGEELRVPVQIPPWWDP